LSREAVTHIDLVRGLRSRLIKYNMKLQKNVSLAKQTTFKIGGRAKYFVSAMSSKDIIEAIKFAKKKSLPFFVLGNGSNALALDEGYEGLIIKIHNTKYKIQDTKVTAEAGTMLKDLVGAAAKASLTGLEWAAGIPGTVGGAVYGNARAFEGKMEDNIVVVQAFDAKSGETKKITKKQCQFSEKTSIFKKNKNLVILSVILKLKKGDKKEIENLIKDHLELRKQRHPLNLGSAGSVFVNKPGQEPSSYLIEKAGLKGKRVGDAQVSGKHAGFIVNLGGAKAKDVLELIKIIKKEVKNKLNVSLEEEIQIIK